MLKMPQTDYIKYLREVKGASINEIAAQVQCSWRTAKKYADGNINLQQQGQRKCERPVIGPYEFWVEAWLEEDLRMPRKQRRTARKIYDMLVESGYSGSERTVRDCVRIKKQEMNIASTEQAIRLDHLPGEAQVDFGKFQAIRDGKVVTYYFLVISFPYSNAQLCRVVPGENAPCFLDSLQKLFIEIAGVPIMIWFDNLTPAVKKILTGTRRDLTEIFKNFQWHYRFQSEFCNANKGNEKGHVEGKIGYVRRNYLTPLPVINDLEEFNRQLNKKMYSDWQRKHYTKDALISELWKEDKEKLLVLPTTQLEIARIETRLVNKYGEVNVDKEIYHLPGVTPGQRVLIKSYWGHIEVLDKHGEKKLYSSPRIYNLSSKDIDWAAELEMFIRRPRAAERATYLSALPEIIKQYLLVSDLKERRERIKAMVELLREYPLEIAIEAVSHSLDYKRTDAASLKAFASYSAGLLIKTRPPLEEPWTPTDLVSWQPDLASYDQLREVPFDA